VSATEAVGALRNSNGSSHGALEEQFSRSALGGFEPVAEVHILDYVRVLYRRRWVASTAFLVVAFTAAVYLLTATPIYEAAARLLIEAEKQNVVAFKEVIEQNDPTDVYYQTRYRLLESRTLAAKTLDTLGLWDYPEFNRSRRLWSAGGRGTAGAGAQPTSSSESSRSVAATDSGMGEEFPWKSRVIDAFLDQLTVSPIRNSRLVDIRFRSADATIAARVANAHAQGYIDKDLEDRLLASKEASDWLVKQLTEQRKKVEESELAVQQYREQNDAVSLEAQQNIDTQKLADINAAVTKAQTERIEKETLYRQIEAIGSDRSAPAAFPALLQNPFIQQLKTQLAELQRQHAQMAENLGELHPDMIKVTTAIQNTEAKLRGEIDRLVQSVRNEYLAAKEQERSLLAALDAQKREVLGMNRKGIAGSALKRDADSSRQLYEGLLQRAKETGVSSELRTNRDRKSVV